MRMEPLPEGPASPGITSFNGHPHEPIECTGSAVAIFKRKETFAEVVILDDVLYLSPELNAGSK